MISLPDFKEKQLLYIRAERGVFNKIKFQNDNIVFSKDDKIINRASCHKVFAVFVLGDITITSGLMKDGIKHGVSFFFLKDNFESYANFGATAEGHYLLRMRQYALSEKQELTMAKAIVGNKITNQCALLKERKLTKGMYKDMNEMFTTVEKADSHDSIRGIEGNASRRFFGEYFGSINWVRRAPRAKQDIPNFLMDIGYSMLFNCMDSLLRLYGFDTYKGFYHKLFFQRKSLACDIMEPFRSVIDKQILKAFNLGQIDEKDFKVAGGKYTIEFEKSRKYAELFMEAIMEHKEELYNFVQGLYRHVMNDGKHEFPEFKIGK
ncbi:MAG: hypothetical protein COV91_01245 [Candidatus Taylorbacteria bacterium CG11_big_fil_rev_8_21_14_0_20_46_11]|uniref:CRISPR-associated endonuclease Cas1 n=1 Tax=Candidatus Taylorbacteria bacterium CG11_big_fil_rev_8_21_14_0_20_46_11 TaxID=1975025 RepID=A0A2H0KCN1_9BACT|nr:MAG: hypothetical protein COV91_01245 [Candidatus Taylorbacteria bacterium CG11_big_fil_rev_8_21_14_0_20_46_11]